jgi:uroporphyrinogen-III decarboxylase
MVKVKETLHGKSCYAGNIPGSLFKAGTPAQVEEYVKDLIGKVGKDGGFILSNGAVLDDAHPDNFKAMFDAGLKYGK